MNRRRASRFAAACALAAALHLAAPPLAAAAPRGPAAALRHESWIESVWSRVADAWKGITATWANDGGGISPWGTPNSQGDEGGGISPWG
jgi:ABC-type sugar transport system substrate-binding protein